MKPFLKWAGGKRQLLPELYRLLPHQLPEMEAFDYIEPFVGGGAMLFFMLQTFPNMRRIVANDINHDLINAYIVVRDNCEELIQRLTCLQNAYNNACNEERASMFYSYRERFNNTDTTERIERASLLIFLNKTCFNGLYRVNAKGEFNVPFGRYKSPLICDTETLREDSKGLQRVEFLCADFAETEKFANTQTFIYLDPPYKPLTRTASFTSYTKDGFDDSSQLRLHDFCIRLQKRGCMLMESNSDVKAGDPNDWNFDDIYDTFFIERVMASRTINSVGNKRGQLSELVMRSYNQTILQPQSL